MRLAAGPSQHHARTGAPFGRAQPGPAGQAECRHRQAECRRVFRVARRAGERGGACHTPRPKPAPARWSGDTEAVRRSTRRPRAGRRRRAPAAAARLVIDAAEAVRRTRRRREKTIGPERGKEKDQAGSRAAAEPPRAAAREEESTRNMRTHTMNGGARGRFRSKQARARAHTHTHARAHPQARTYTQTRVRGRLLFGSSRDTCASLSRGQCPSPLLQRWRLLSPRGRRMLHSEATMARAASAQ